MDPNACLKRTLEALADRDYQAAKEGYEDLQGWIARGGFAPRDPNWEESILRKAPSFWREGWR